MLAQTRAELERSGTSVRDLINADAREVSELLPDKVDYALIANTFHGVPEKTEMAGAVASVLKRGGLFSIINWYPLPREDTVVLGKPRGPKTGIRMSPDDVRAVVEPAGFELERIVELPPYHYGAIFRVKDAN
jgi:predicted methyltransferase